MSFRDYVWSTNPSSITISDSRLMKSVTIPYKGVGNADLGLSPRIISGKGEFIGGDAYIQYENLRKLFVNGEKGLLVIPTFSVYYVAPYKLEIKGTSEEKVISYTFSFYEVV